MVDSRSSTIERAYELARFGHFSSLTEIRDRLRAESHEDAPSHLSSLTLTANLRRLMVAARLDS
jgi:hypothetical protein